MINALGSRTQNWSHSFCPWRKGKGTKQPLRLSFGIMRFRSSHRKLKHRRLCVRLFRPEDDRWKFRMVDRIGIMLRFQTKSLVLLVHDAAFTLELAVQEVSGV